MDLILLDFVFSFALVALIGFIYDTLELFIYSRSI